MRIKVDGKEGEFKRLPSTPPPGAKAKSVMTLEATVVNQPQKLRTVRPFGVMTMAIPPSLGAEAQMVLFHLLDVFLYRQVVREGTLGDLVFGCEHAAPPLPAALVIAAVHQLQKAGYIQLQAPDNEIVTLQADRAAEAWIKYTPKLLDLVYGREP